VIFDPLTEAVAIEVSDETASSLTVPVKPLLEAATTASAPSTFTVTEVLSSVKRAKESSTVTVKEAVALSVPLVPVTVKVEEPAFANEFRVTKPEVALIDAVATLESVPESME